MVKFELVFNLFFISLRNKKLEDQLKVVRGILQFCNIYQWRVALFVNNHLSEICWMHSWFFAKLSFKLLELTETQSLENAQLKREKAVVENDLLKTQVSKYTWVISVFCNVITDIELTIVLKSFVHI